MGNAQFRQDEIVMLKHWDKDKKQFILSPHPKVGGRLRLAHEENEQIGINSVIVRFEEKLAVVKVETTTKKGQFCGLGTASAERDEKLAESLLELAETRAIARSLRFAGDGVEYCSAEEVSHLDGTVEPPQETAGSGNGGNGQAADKGNGQDRPGKGNGTLTNAQLKAIYAIGKRKGLGNKALDELAVQVFGVKVEVLSKDQASHIIKTLQG